MADSAQYVLTPEELHQTKLDLLRWDAEGQFPTSRQQELVREGFQRLGFERIKLELIEPHLVYALTMRRGRAMCRTEKEARKLTKRLAGELGFRS